jgi:hypothetical protein
MSVPSDSELEAMGVKEAWYAFLADLDEEAQEWTDEVEASIRANTQSVTEAVRRILNGQDR